MGTPTLDEAVLSAGHGRPLLFVNATSHTLDPVIGDLTGADLMVVGTEIVAVGPGLHTAAEDDNAIVIDCTGLALLPVFSPSVIKTIALRTPLALASVSGGSGESAFQPHINPAGT